MQVGTDVWCAGLTFCSENKVRKGYSGISVLQKQSYWRPWANHPLQWHPLLRRLQKEKPESWWLNLDHGSLERMHWSVWAVIFCLSLVRMKRGAARKTCRRIGVCHFPFSTGRVNFHTVRVFSALHFCIKTHLNHDPENVSLYYRFSFSIPKKWLA